MSQPVSVAITPIADETAAERSPVGDFDARWATWQERGRLHDRVVRRRLTIAVPAIIIVAAIVYLLLIR